MDDPEERGGGGWSKIWVGGRGVNKLRFFGDRWDFSGQLGGAPGSTKDHSKLDFGWNFDVFFKLFWSIRDRSGSHLGPLWDNFYTVLEVLEPQSDQLGGGGGGLGELTHLISFSF